MPLQVVNGPIIAAGQSLSSAVDCSGGDVVRIRMPPQWDSASDLITFAVSTDNINFHDLFRYDGWEVQCKMIPGSSVGVISDVFRSASWLKIRSGLRAAPIAQSAQRAFSIVVDVGPAVAQALPIIPVRLVT